MKGWKYLIFLAPTILVLTCAITGIHKDFPVIVNLTGGVAENNDIVEAKTVDKKTESEEESTDSEEASDSSETPDSSETSVTPDRELKQGTWKDGVYSGSGTGYGGVIKVSVTIRDGKIADITVVSHDKETPDFYAKAEAVVQKILQAQSTNVDVISGATYSSNGIRQAVIDALNQAVVDETDKVTEDDHTTQTPDSLIQDSTSKKQTNKKTASGLPADGTYAGSAVCENFGYTVSVKVTFKNGKATKIFGLKITGNDDSANEEYWTKAYKPTVKKILGKQSGDVDAVSGATFSSNAIMEAFENAKAKAVKKNGKKAKPTNKKKNNSKKESDEETVINGGDEVSSTEPGKVIDGTYHVEAVCEPDEDEAFERYNMYADVTFMGGKLIKIDNLGSDADSNQKYYQKAANGTDKYKGVVAQLLEKQSASEISAVSGATCSSKTILALYVEGLKKATGQESQTEITEETTESTEKTDTEVDESEGSDGELLAVKDGIYETTVIVEPDEDEEFDPYWLTTEILFKSGRLENILIISSTDDSNQGYYTRALNGTSRRAGILEQLQNNPLQVPDVVSGATCSCNALYEAFKNACAAAGE